jgi:hypothetical protein
MTITRANAETELVSRCGKRMALVSMAVTVVGTNADLNGPLASALRKMGLVSSITVTDANLAALTDDQIEEFFDRAELRVLQNILGNSDFNNFTIGPRSESMSNLTSELDKAIQRKEDYIRRAYGDNNATLEYGNLVQNFQETED